MVSKNMKIAIALGVAGATLIGYSLLVNRSGIPKPEQTPTGEIAGIQDFGGTPLGFGVGTGEQGIPQTFLVPVTEESLVSAGGDIPPFTPDGSTLSGQDGSVVSPTDTGLPFGLTAEEILGLGLTGGFVGLTAKQFLDQRKFNQQLRNKLGIKNVGELNKAIKQSSPPRTSLKAPSSTKVLATGTSSGSKLGGNIIKGSKVLKGAGIIGVLAGAGITIGSLLGVFRGTPLEDTSLEATRIGISAEGQQISRAGQDISNFFNVPSVSNREVGNAVFQKQAEPNFQVPVQSSIVGSSTSPASSIDIPVTASGGTGRVITVGGRSRRQDIQQARSIAKDFPTQSVQEISNIISSNRAKAEADLQEKFADRKASIQKGGTVKK